MKKFLSLVLVISILLSTATIISVQPMAAMPSPTALEGYENVCLTYTFSPSRGDYGRQTEDDFMPYVAYLDEDGAAKDFFFDSYLFLPCCTFRRNDAWRYK